LAEQILKKYPIKDFLVLRYQDLINIKGVNSAKACIILASQELIRAIIRDLVDLVKSKSISETI